MSNDVQIARVAKIGSEVPRRNGKQPQQKQQMHRDMKSITKGGGGGVIGNDIEFVFGSISPRGGGPTAGLGQHKHVVESFEMDSPEHTQRDTTESDNNISSCSTLDIVNKVEQLSVQQLENRVRELSQRLQQADRQLVESNAERDRCHKRLEVVSQAHECRITEMHCVIAELSKKLRSKQEHIIMEEQEPDGDADGDAELEGECSELSYQEGSVYNSELNPSNADGECQTEPLEDYDAACSSADNMHIKPHKGQLEALQEEVLHLRAQIALLQSEISIKDKDSAVVEDQSNVIYYACDLEANDRAPDEQCLNDLNACVSLTSPQNCVKLAERVKLRCVSKTAAEDEEDDDDEDDDDDSDLSNVDINLVEHLVGKPSTLVESLLSPLQLELERLQRKMEQLKMRNTLLSLTLDESKEHTEQLYLLCGKYESNAVALQLALNCSDRAIEAYDVMLALLESRLALLSEKSAAADESRLAVETVAHHLLIRLESEKNLSENSLGPWQHSIDLSATETPNGKRFWTADDDLRLRYHVSKLKGRRSVVQHTIVNLESPFSDVYEKKRLALEKSHELRDQDKERKSPIDLETAVVMQELLELREQNQQLKAKKDEAEREQQQANERVGILHEALKQLQAANRVSYSEAEHAALTEQQLVEALGRETELKGRIQALLSINATQKASDEQCEQMQQNFQELQKSNHNLSQLLEQSRRKYQLRVKKLEQKIVDMRLEQEQLQRHGPQVPETTL